MCMCASFPDKLDLAILHINFHTRVAANDRWCSATRKVNLQIRRHTEHSSQTVMVYPPGTYDRGHRDENPYVPMLNFIAHVKMESL